MNFPEVFQWVSLPYLLIGALLLGSGLFYICLAERAYILFGLTSIFAAGYALASSVAYSSTVPEAVSFWIRVQFACSVPLVVFFAQFSADHLGFFKTFYKWIFPLLTLSFLLQFPLPKWMLLQDLHYQSFQLGAATYSMPRLPLGTGGYILVSWYLLNALFIGWNWIKFILKEGHDFSLLLAFLIFVSTGVYDLGIVAGFYQGPLIFVFGFCGLLLAMGYQLLNNFMMLSRQYQKTTQEVQQVNEEMRNLVETISHDIKGPLVSIDGFIDILESTPPEDRQGKNYFERIRANADHMKILLEDFAEFLRVGRVRDSIHEVDAQKAVEQALSLMDLATKFPKVRVELGESWPSWMGSAKRLQQIVTNLVGNSVKHGRKEDLQVRIYGKRKQGGLELTVEDNGPGIPAQLREKIFEPFFRENTATEGSGLGLAIVQKAAKGMGGNAWIDPDYTEGTRIKVFLPTLEASAED
jgi:signal transduction histidine kinase